MSEQSYEKKGAKKETERAMEKRTSERNVSGRRLLDGVIFGILLAAVSVLTLVLFYRQTTGSPERYHSDMKAYILEMQGLDSGYSFPYPVFFKLSALFHLLASPELSVALATMVLNSLAMVLVKLALNKLLLKEWETAIEKHRSSRSARGERSGLQGWMAGVFLSLISLSLFFISMLYPPKGIYLPGIQFKYLGVFTANPFHNATYMAARPFAILAFLWFGKLMPVYEEGIKGKGRDYLLFSVFLLLATMTKPSFTIVLVGAAGLIMLYRLCRSGFRNFVPTVQLGLAFVPTFIDLLYQFKGVFVPQEGAEGGIGFCFGEIWRLYCRNLPLAIGLAVGFPVLVLLLNWKELKRDSLYRFSWQIYLMSFAMAFFLYEKGFRKPDFNFSWGYMYGIFFCHLGALIVLSKATATLIAEEADNGKGAREGRHRVVAVLAQWLAYLWHVVCGILYFGVFMSGGMYY